MTKSQSLRKKDVAVLNKVFDKIRAGCSLYGSLSAMTVELKLFTLLLALMILCSIFIFLFPYFLCWRINNSFC